MQIKRKKYQWAGDLVGTNMLPTHTTIAKKTPKISPFVSGDNWQYKQSNNTPSTYYNYNAKPDNTVVNNKPIPKPTRRIQRENEQATNQQYGTITQNNNTPNLYNTYFNTPSNTKGTGIIPFASNMINASNVVGAGMAAKEGIKYGIKKAGQYANKKMLNYGKDAFTPNLSNVGENLLENKSSLINSQTIDLQRNVAPKVKVAKLSFDDVDLGNGLVLRNNPSRTTDQTKILGKNMALKEVLDKETGEYIKLSSWTDENGKLFYKMSANMPSSRLKAGKAYLELEKHIPVGATLMDDTSLSYDSFLNTVKQTKNPKFKTIVHNEFPMNNSSKTVSGLKNKYTGQNLAFATKEEAEQNLTKINELLQKHNLPNAKINYQTQYIDDGDELTYYGITIPQIGLEKLYQLGIPLTALGLSQQNQNNSYRKLGGKLMNNKYEYGGRIGDETFNVGNLRKGNTSGDSLRTMLGSNKIRISTRQPKWALNNGPIRKQRNLGLQAKYAKLGGRLYQVAGKTQLNAMPVDTGYTAPAIPNTNYYAPANSTYVNKNDTNRLKLAQEKERKRKEEYNKQLYQQGKIEPKYYSVADARQSYIDGGVAALKIASIPDAVMGETANYILNKDKFDYKNLYSDHPEFIGDALHIQNPYVKFGVNAVLSPLGGKFKVIKGMEGLSNAEKALVLSKSFGKRVEHSLLKPSVVETPVNTYHFSHIKDDNNTKNKPHKTGGIIKRKRY